MASKMKEWTSIVSSLRMSQVLDMYYSGRGVAFDKHYRACRRRQNFLKLVASADLSQQVAAVARMISYTHIIYGDEDILPATDQLILPAVEKTLELFNKHLG